MLGDLLKWLALDSLLLDLEESLEKSKEKVEK